MYKTLWGDLLPIITLKRLTEAIEKRLNIGREKAQKYAAVVMDLFGFDDRIIDNSLEQNDRQLFYMLEAEGILKTEREEFVLHDGRYWRIHYWRLQKNLILQYSDSKKGLVEKRDTDTLQRYNIYMYLPKDMWAARKTLAT